jgi:hypothetical protein
MRHWDRMDNLWIATWLKQTQRDAQMSSMCEYVKSGHTFRRRAVKKTEALFAPFSAK